MIWDYFEILTTECSNIIEKIKETMLIQTEIPVVRNDFLINVTLKLYSRPHYTVIVMSVYCYCLVGFVPLSNFQIS